MQHKSRLSSIKQYAKQTSLGLQKAANFETPQNLRKNISIHVRDGKADKPWEGWLQVSKGDADGPGMPVRQVTSMGRVDAFATSTSASEQKKVRPSTASNWGDTSATTTQTLDQFLKPRSPRPSKWDSPRPGNSPREDAVDKRFSHCRRCGIEWKAPDPPNGACTKCKKPVSDGRFFQPVDAQSQKPQKTPGQSSQDQWRHLWSYALPYMQPVAPEVSDLGLPAWWVDIQNSAEAENIKSPATTPSTASPQRSPGRKGTNFKIVLPPQQGSTTPGKAVSVSPRDREQRKRGQSTVSTKTVSDQRRTDAGASKLNSVFHGVDLAHLLANS